jgi:uncharacterized protein
MKRKSLLLTWRASCFVIFSLLFAILSFAQKPPICRPIRNSNSEKIIMETTQKNVFGTPLKLASIDPITGYFRTGYCSTDQNDRGVHVVAAVVTDAFLQYSKTQGNDLISPYPPSGFPGLKAGNIWCLCALRWKEALAAGVAPPIILEATNIKALEYISLEVLKKNALR